MSNPIPVVVTLFAVALLALSYLFGRVSVTDDCRNYGKSVIGSVSMQCEVSE